MLIISGYLKTERFVLDDLGYHLARSLGPHPGGSLPKLRSHALNIDTTTKTYATSHNDTKQQRAEKASNVIRKANKSDTLVCDLFCGCACW